METLQRLWDHRQAIGAAIMAALVAWTPIATLLARVIARPAPSASWWKRGLYDLFIDTPSWVAALGHSGILGGSFNVPGVPSRAPEQNPLPSESKAMRGRGSFPPGENTRFRRVVSSLIIPIIIAVSLAAWMVAFAGCGTIGAAVGQSLGACELGALPKELESVLAQVLAAALSPAGVDWEAQLEQAAATAGPAQGQCLMQAAATWFEQMTSKKGEPLPAYVEAQKRLRSFIDKHAPRAAGGRTVL